MLRLSAASASVIATGQKVLDRRLYRFPVGDSSGFSLRYLCQENSILNSDMKFSTPHPKGIKNTAY